jgi:hypothetical protein
MELDELKSFWEKVNVKIEKQLKLNTAIIEKMIRQDYRSTVRRIVYPEVFGSLGCLATAFALIWYFDRFNTPGLRVSGGLSVLLLAALAIVSFASLRGLQHADLGLSTYLDTLKRFTVRKIRFQKLQQLNMALAFFFMIAFIPTAVRLFSEKDITQTKTYWLVTLPICALLQVLVSRWVYRHYARALKEAESLLADLES